MTDPHAVPLDDEPRTPMWLPALGAAIFVAAALWWAVTPSAPPPAPETAPSASAAAAAEAATPPPAGNPARPTTAAANAQPAATGRPVLAPGMASADTQQRLKELRDRMRANQPGGPGHP